jgi:hypothetical protein
VGDRHLKFYEIRDNLAYIPGDNEHGIRNTGNGRSRFFYAFAVLPPSLPRWGTPVAAR